MKLKELKKSIDWCIIIIPFLGIVSLCTLFILKPEESGEILTKIRYFFSNDCGVYYLLVTLAFFVCSFVMAFSKYGKIKLGENAKPEYPTVIWGMMIFNSTFAADLIFYSLSEWTMYATEPHVQNLGDVQKWSAVYPLFHWGPLSWGVYVVLIAAFGFMLHIRKRDKQKFSEGLRPVLGNKVDGPAGKIVDLFAVFALLAGTSATFSIATPLISAAISKVTGIPNSRQLTIVILIFVAAVYTMTVLFGMKGIAKLASYSSYFFIALLAGVFFLGGEMRFILESGVTSLGTLGQNFISLSTFIDPLRKTTFAQDWTFFYWSYALTWCIATPFFIATISKGRTIKNTILGTYFWGIAASFTSFIVLGNYGMAQQFKNGVDILGVIQNGGSYPDAVMKIVETLPMSKIFMILICITMISFYSTTFDALTMVVSSYSYKKLKIGEEPDKKVRVFWAVLFILLPIALLFSEKTIHALQSISVIAALPIGIIVLLIIYGFFKDAKKYLTEKEHHES